MPIEFEEYKNDRPMRFSETGRPLGREPLPKTEKTESPILGFLIKMKIVRDEDHAKFILLLIIIIAFGLSVYYSIKTYQNFNPQVNTAPIDLNEIELGS
jgi:hypothetical protein